MTAHRLPLRASRRRSTAVDRPRTDPGRSGAGSRLRLVYFVAPSAHFAGIERTVHEIATGMTEAAGDRLEVHVVYSSRHQDDVLDRTLYRKHVLGVDRLFALPVVMRRRFREIRPDIVVFPQVEASTIGWCVTRGLGIKMSIAHLHGNPLVEERDGTRRSRFAFKLFRGLVARRMTAVLAVSPSLAEFARSTIVTRTPVEFVPNPVRRLGRVPGSPRRTSTFRFVSVGRLSRQKGQDVLLRAVRVALDEGLHDFSMEIVGDGPELRSLQSLAHELRVEHVVSFAGYSAQPEQHLTNADCFVLASRWEGFGVALVEALQYGLPLLSTDCDFGPADIITDDRIGRLVPEGDARALGRAMSAITRRREPQVDRDHRQALASAYERGPAVREHLRVLAHLAAGTRSPRFATLLAPDASAAQDERS